MNGRVAAALVLGMLGALPRAAGPDWPRRGGQRDVAHLAVAPNAVLVKDVRMLALWRVP